MCKFLMYKIEKMFIRVACKSKFPLKMEHTTWNANHQLLLCPNVDVVRLEFILYFPMHSNLFQFTYTHRKIYMTKTQLKMLRMKIFIT